jgi:hypothetical protein
VDAIARRFHPSFAAENSSDQVRSTSRARTFAAVVAIGPAGSNWPDFSRRGVGPCSTRLKQREFKWIKAEVERI